jgi:hypothetical protein
LKLLKGKVRELGARVIDGRSRLARTLLELREAIHADLGGKDQLTQAQLILVDDVARLTLWIDSVDAYLVGLESIVNKRKKSLVPVVRERTSLVETRARLLQALGLERKVRELSLAEWLRSPPPEDLSHAKDTATTKSEQQSVSNGDQDTPPSSGNGPSSPAAPEAEAKLEGES